MTADGSDSGTLVLTLPSDLPVPDRAATVLRMQSLVLADRPGHVRLHLTPGPASPSALSVLARLHRLCKTLGIPLSTAQQSAEDPLEGSTPTVT
ncbi:hypothetical protein ACF1BN_37280 [Streptomyces sp. NPDC014861]|uniref:hypothetical protein n=1 Tax=Streptomyces sp. NPDC014861 TaxID=3364923 RepID=UPI0036FC1D78